MTITQLVSELQKWLAVHGDMHVTYSGAFFANDERPVRGLGVGENEDTGQHHIILFTDVEPAPQDTSHELN